MLFGVRVLECAEQSIFFPSFTGRILGEGDVLRDLCDWQNNFGSHAIYLSREKMIAWLPIKFSILHDKIWGKNAPNIVFCDLHNCTILMHQRSQVQKTRDQKRLPTLLSIWFDRSNTAAMPQSPYRNLYAEGANLIRHSTQRTSSW